MPAKTRAEAFRAMHDRPDPADPLVIPNVWDALSARVFADAGFPILATSSAAVAASLGYEDGGHTPADEMFAAVTRIVRSAGVPVTADIEAGYGLPPKEITERLIEAGVVGCNLEDTDPATGNLKDPDEHADWLAELSTAAGDRLVLNARVDTFLYDGDRDRRLESAIRRGVLYTAAGADVVYPILAPVDLLPAIAESLRAPLNALQLPGGPSPAELGRLGASRVTFGHTLHGRVTDALRDIAAEVRGG
ncbi:isocitrate lyase/phosphoenolpyruvate mutase family protein [Streptomyces sp. NPDC059168]|uniref:isocitrate lyase/PEP mutase family protein n=1 Tax=Streptomyces sp. NPDC059168 TaxID=3346753 RepID=UPI0036C28E68